MTHTLSRVTSFQIVGAYKLQITFHDRTEQTIDFEPILADELYRPLRISTFSIRSE
jgi:hypothetical protein